MHGFLLAVRNKPETARASLEAAARVVGALNDAHMTALCIRIDPKSTILPSDEVLTKEREAELNRISAKRAAGVYRIYQDWRETNADLAGDRICWDDPVGTVEREVSQRGQDADLIVLARPAGMRDFYGRQAVKTAIFEADRPVLLVPNTMKITAWDDRSRSYGTTRGQR